jgi:hypothetical protein
MTPPQFKPDDKPDFRPDFRPDRSESAQPHAGSHPADAHIDQALASLNQVQPSSHFQQRLTARISRDLNTPVSLPFYRRLSWQTTSILAMGLAAAFLGGVLARPLFHHAIPLQPAISQPVASKPAVPPPTVIPTAQPAFNVRMADGHNAAMSPSGLVASARSRAEHTRTQLASHGQSQDTNLGRLANKPPRPGQHTSGQPTSDQVSAGPAVTTPAPAAQTAPATQSQSTQNGNSTQSAPTSTPPKQ